ncbi:MAG: IS200/IS605 family transposase [Holosporaceae bacterium]|nr:IS200/IS605 family transposase [Holosporaceae bacterium]
MNNRERYVKGAHTILELQYHFVWKTKYSYKVLNDDVALRLRDLVKEVCSLQGMSIIRGNTRPYHVHVLVRAPSHLSPAKIAQYLKGRTAHISMYYTRSHQRSAIVCLKVAVGECILVSIWVTQNRIWHQIEQATDGTLQSNQKHF